MNIADFRSCPKCGDRTIYIGKVKDGVAVICFYCGTEGLVALTALEAKDKWNQG